MNCSVCSQVAVIWDSSARVQVRGGWGVNVLVHAGRGRGEK